MSNNPSTGTAFVGLNELMGITDPTVPNSADPTRQALTQLDDYETPVPFKENAGTVEEEPAEDDDFIFARKNMHRIVEQGQEVLDLALKEARMTPHPRSIEVASSVLKQMSETNKDLLKLHRSRADTKEVKRRGQIALEVARIEAAKMAPGSTVTHHNTQVNITVEETTSDLLQQVIDARKIADEQMEARMIEGEFTDVDSDRSKSDS